MKLLNTRAFRHQMRIQLREAARGGEEENVPTTRLALAGAAVVLLGCVLTNAACESAGMGV